MKQLIGGIFVDSRRQFLRCSTWDSEFVVRFAPGIRSFFTLNLWVNRSLTRLTVHHGNAIRGAKELMQSCSDGIPGFCHKRRLRLHLIPTTHREMTSSRQPCVTGIDEHPFHRLQHILTFVQPHFNRSFHVARKHNALFSLLSPRRSHHLCRGVVSARVRRSLPR